MSRNKLITYLKYIHHSIIVKLFNKPIIKQEILLRLALMEEGVDLSSVKIKCYHDIGLSTVNGIEFGIKYPTSFYLKATKLARQKRTIDFYFNGSFFSKTI